MEINLIVNIFGVCRARSKYNDGDYQYIHHRQYKVLVDITMGTTMSSFPVLVKNV